MNWEFLTGAMFGWFVTCVVLSVLRRRQYWRTYEQKHGVRNNPGWYG